MSAVSLGEMFTAWLVAEGDRRAEAPPLAAALAGVGYVPEARLLASYATEGSHTTELPPGPSAWDGRRVHVGPLLPDAAPGELWLDTVELALMALLPGSPLENVAPEARHRWSPHRNWFALRPVASWQCAGFLAAATARAGRAGDGLRLLDALRLIPDDERLPIVGATAIEVLGYTRWFGKRVVDRWDWVDAARLFGPDVAHALWTPGMREWAGGVHDLDVFAAIEFNEIDEDDRDALDAEEADSAAPEERRFFELYEGPPGGAAFRSTVDPQLGLLAVPVRWPGLELSDSARR